MKKTLLILFSLITLCGNAQIVNRFRDSTWFKAGVRFDSNFVISKNAAAGKVLTSDAFGTAKWQTPSGGSQSFQQTLDIGNTQSKNDTILGNTKAFRFKDQSQFSINQTGAPDTDFSTAKVLIASGSLDDDTIPINIFGFAGGANDAINISAIAADGRGIVLSGQSDALEGTQETGISTDSTGISKTGTSTSGIGISHIATSTSGTAYNVYATTGGLKGMDFFGHGVRNGIFLGATADTFSLEGVGTGGIIGFRWVGTGDSLGGELNGHSTDGDGLGLEGWSVNHFGNSNFGNSVNSIGNFIGGNSTNGADVVIQPVNHKMQILDLPTASSKDSVLGIDASNNIYKIPNSGGGGQNISNADLTADGGHLLDGNGNNFTITNYTSWYWSNTATGTDVPFQVDATADDASGFAVNAQNNSASSAILLSGSNSGAGADVEILSGKLKLTGIPAYDDDTAAGLGGLTTGMIYQTTGSALPPLNAAGILMVKQ